MFPRVSSVFPFALSDILPCDLFSLGFPHVSCVCSLSVLSVMYFPCISSIIFHTFTVHFLYSLVFFPYVPPSFPKVSSFTFYMLPRFFSSIFPWSLSNRSLLLFRTLSRSFSTLSLVHFLYIPSVLLYRFPCSFSTRSLDEFIYVSSFSSFSKRSVAHFFYLPSFISVLYVPDYILYVPSLIFYLWRRLLTIVPTLNVAHFPCVPSLFIRSLVWCIMIFFILVPAWLCIDVKF